MLYFMGLRGLKVQNQQADYRFTLTAPLSYSVVIPEGATLVDDGGQKIGVLLEEVFFDIGVEEAIGKVELQEFISTLDVRLPLCKILYHI